MFCDSNKSVTVFRPSIVKKYLQKADISQPAIQEEQLTIVKKQDVKIEGAFVQGIGLYTLEEIKFSRDGTLLTFGPATYKIPGFQDIPMEFNVHILPNSTNDNAVYSSKGVGEPPLFLASSVLFAIKDAIAAARGDVGLEGIFRLDSPATSERIRLSCADQFTKQAANTTNKSSGRSSL